MRVMLFAALVAVGVQSPLDAQSSGARGGLASPPVLAAAGGPGPKEALNYITIEGRAEIRVDPTELRIVLAITSDGPAAAECQVRNEEQVSELRNALSAINIPADMLTVDFISLLPVYDWEIENQNGRRVAVESHSGYRLQNNVHIRVSDEAQAQAAIAAAFEVNLTDVLAVDHWNSELDSHRVAAQEKAVQEARRKADLLLNTLFEERPAPVNVHEETHVIYPADLYASFENVYASQYRQAPWPTNVPRIGAFRPKNTYLRGFYEDADSRDSSIPMRPQISVVSTVKLYFQSPARQATPK